MTLMELIDSNGKLIGRIPVCHFKLNNNQNICVYGMDFESKGGLKKIFKPEHSSAKYLGKLSGMGYVLKCITRNSMMNEGWNFDMWPDAEVIMVENHNHG